AKTAQPEPLDRLGTGEVEGPLESARGDRGKPGMPSSAFESRSPNPAPRSLSARRAGASGRGGFGARERGGRRSCDRLARRGCRGSAEGVESSCLTKPKSSAAWRTTERTSLRPHPLTPRLM
ncbi:MAG TPA: hypothetical protein DFS52_18190, partial [Myxococcales bacterium]|nr:hypothetical protein [Myxococcales bacterium]